MALGKENADGEQTSDTAELLKKRTKQARHWYEIVRSLRAFYDHFRIAFPHLEALPQAYSQEWAASFQESAREFLQTDMDSVRKVLVGEYEVSEIEGIFARLLNAAEHAEEEHERIEEVSGQVVTQADDTASSAELQKNFEELKKQYYDLEQEVSTREKRIVDLEGQLRKNKRDGVALEPEAEPVVSKVITDAGEDDTKYAQLKWQFDELMDDHKQVQAKLDSRNDEERTLGAQLKKLSTTVENPEPVVAKPQLNKSSSPDEQIREYEQKIKANGLMLSGLRSELERAQSVAEEFKDDAKRERDRQRLFKEEMESERQELRQQIQRLNAISTKANLPSLEEVKKWMQKSYTSILKT